MKKKENTLTKVEFQVMSILWDINHSACAWDIIERWEEPKPAYTTIATYLKMLYERGYVDFFKNKGEGKTHMYVAKIGRAEYTRKTMQEVKKNFFDGSVKSMLSFFVKEENLTAKDIQEFYLKELQRVSASSVIHYHANIHKALKYAVKIDLIDVNPADKVERPKKDRYVGSFYDADEVNALFEAAKGTKLELPILFGAFYGLRRSEAIGLKWDAIDFDQNTITIRHTVTSCDLDGKRVLVASDTTKTKSSMRTLPLVPFMRERLLTLKEEQQENRRLCGRSYIKDYIGYVCVNEIGDLIKPHYVTESFPKLLKANGLRHIRYHDLRHSCASLLLANGVPMKQIQEWLGHSDFSTTANIYAHLDYSSKLTSADAMLNGLGLAQN